MATHTCKPGHDGILADDCARCHEHASSSMLLALDQERMADLWEIMVAVEHSGTLGRYATSNDAVAGRQLYHVAIWMERYLGVTPWRPLDEIVS